MDDGRSPPHDDIGHRTPCGEIGADYIRLSKKFYETFGEDVTNELVNWFNSVDTTYRGELRELNESNFARFDAKMGERLAELRGELKTEMAQVRNEISQLETKFADRLGQVKSDLLKWMFGFWASVVVALIVLALRS